MPLMHAWTRDAWHRWPLGVFCEMPRPRVGLEMVADTYVNLLFSHHYRMHPMGMAADGGKSLPPLHMARCLRLVVRSHKDHG